MLQKNKTERQVKNYTDNVFINCPFDSDYKSIFHAIIFSIVDSGFIPRCALEANASSDVRIDKILKIIDECKYGIHDISRTELDDVNNLPRFNMPLELGIFIGCKKYSNAEKSYMVLDSISYRYQKFISDIAGQDIRIHNNSPKEAVSKVRDYLLNSSDRISIPSGKLIYERFEKFNNALPDICKRLKWDIDNLAFMEYYLCIKSFLISINDKTTKKGISTKPALSAKKTVKKHSTKKVMKR